MEIKKTILFCMMLIFLSGLNIVQAGTTGKITGVVRDAETGEPLIGANIILKGTAQGAATDLDGNYLILNVRPGSYTLVFSSIGYQSTEVSGVTAKIDLTTTIDVRLNPTTLELGETITVSAERPLVQMDMTSSLSTITAADIENLPVQEVNDVLKLNAGIVENAGRLHIRGGRPGEVAYWVDGVSATDGYDGNIGVTVENAAVQELQVVSGTFNAEYGQAMSGIVNIVTKDGGEKYSGQIKVYTGDYVSSGDEFGLYKSLTTAQNPVTRQTDIIEGEWESPLDRFNPTYNAEFSLSGPIPFLEDKLTFFTNGRYYSNEGYFYGRNWYKPSGAVGDGSLVALNPYEKVSFQGKLTYKLSNAIRVSYNAFWNTFKRERNYYGFNTNGIDVNLHDFKYTPYGFPQELGYGLSQIFSISHVLSPTTFYELKINNFYSERESYVYENPLAVVDYLVSVEADTAKGIIAEIFDPNTVEGQAKLQRLIDLRHNGFEYISDPDGPDGYIHPDLIAQPTANSFMNRGMDINHSKRSTQYWVAKFDLTSQLNKSNELKIGGEVRMHELKLNDFLIIPATDGGTVIEPFQPAIPEIGNTNRNDYVRKPREFSAYVQDKVEMYDLIFNVGLRFDYFDANSFIPSDPSDPNIYSPFKNKNKYTNWVDIPDNYDGTMDQYIKERLDAGEIREYTPEERRSFMHKDVDAQMAISPRIGIAYPITDRGVIHFSYGHFFQIPEFQYLYQNPDYKLTSGTGTGLFGNADLSPQKTVMYEIGLQQQLSDDIGIDLTLFYRDVRDWVGTSPIIETAKTAVRYSIYENKDYENVKGVTLKLQKRFANNFSARLDYSFQTAEGTYSNPTDAFNAEQANDAPILALVPMNWDQNHTVNAQIIYRLSDWTFSAIGNYWSGKPYTPSFPVSEKVGASAVTGLTINSARLPDQMNVDLTISKSFDLGSFNVEVFANVYNLLDQRDETFIYTDTGTAEYTTTIDPSKILYNEERVSTVEDFVNQPTYYSEPRQVQVGLIFGF